MVSKNVAYNGRLESVCYHPSCLFNHFGDFEGALLSPGNVHSAECRQEVLEPAMEGYHKQGIRLLFQADAVFSKLQLHEFLESRDIGYAIRLPATEVLQGDIKHLPKRPRGRPPQNSIV